MIGTGMSRYTTAPNLCHIRVTLDSSVDHTPDRALSFVSLDLGQTRGAASLVSMLSHIHVRSISLDVTTPPLTLTLTLSLNPNCITLPLTINGQSLLSIAFA